MSIRKQYDTDLESLKNSLTEMGRNSADAVENALEALCVACLLYTSDAADE